ncbi:hypothetical protein CAPTEDRAFT_215385 [Capitella teleta]|uniref:Cationic amino acid transporter C-terminal domain-containing protein n=1 Tax=Capitella teleta TaxID=283909 RepID=R7UMK9_CAPTE|nr:hypothetical protein CAPTEDRAFT_215385 [Capitella teleta]|eukprot:ELU07338.1 hypothetical protein CAPTEDRAFT_215385 [Capitella teleta]
MGDQSDDHVTAATPSARWHMLFRIKTSTRVFMRESPLYHTTFDLVSASLSAVLPLSIFVLVGLAAQDCAGPSVCLSAVLAAISAMLSGFSYAELRSRCHRGQTTAYEYVYRVAGELLAFCVGCTLLLHHVTCAAMAARAISANIDVLTSFSLTNLTLSHVGRLPIVDATLDFVGFFISLIAMLLVSVNLLWPQRRQLNVGSAAVCVSIAIFAMVVAVFRFDFSNWATTQLFFTNGAIGVFSGAAILVLGFSTYEQTFRSTDFTSRVIRRPVILSETINFSVTTLLLIGVGSSLTLLSLNSSWSSEAPFAESYLDADISWMKYLVSSVTVLFLIPVLLSQFHSGVMMLGDLSQDGLLPRVFSFQNDDKHLPLWSAAVCGIISSISSMLLTLTALAQTAAISFLLVHTITALIVLALRFRPTEESANEAQKRRQIQKRLRKRTGNSVRNNNRVKAAKNSYGATTAPRTEEVNISESPSNSSGSGILNTSAESGDVELLGRQESLQGQPREQLSSSDSDIDDVVEEYKFNVCIRVLTEQRHRDFFLKVPSVESYRRAMLAILAFLVASVCTAAILLRGQSHIAHGQPIVFVFLAIFVAILAVCLVVAARQPTDTVECAFLLIKVPGVPWLPLVGAFINMNLMVSLPAIAWVILSVWSISGVIVYLAFSMKNSNEAQVQEHRPGERRGLLPPLPSRESVSSKFVPASTGHPPARGYRNLLNEEDTRVIEERA